MKYILLIVISLLTTSLYAETPAEAEFRKAQEIIDNFIGKKPATIVPGKSINEQLRNAAAKERVRYNGLRGASTVQMVGYQPVIIALPQGSQLWSAAVVSGDRRYVRFSGVPMFSSVGQVHTFNMYTGENNIIR